jgi:hypothetical protein
MLPSGFVRAGLGIGDWGIELLRIRWTGLGCLSPIVLGVFAVAAVVTYAVVAERGGFAPGIAAALVLLASGVVNWLLGRALNSRRTPEGREWHDTHTVNDQPMQDWTVPPVLVALVVGSVALAYEVWRSTSPFLGVVAFLVVIVGLMVAYGGYRTRRRLAGVADEREKLARAQGWHYQAKASGLAERWQDLIGWRAYSIAPYGVVSGELQGLPFTVFDSETGLDGRTEVPSTTWVVHLPVAYPRLVVPVLQRSLAEQMGPDPARTFSDFVSGRAGLGPDLTADDLRAESENTGFAELLLTPQVRQATINYGLMGWRIEGRDLIFVSAERSTPPTPDEIVERAERLVSLARLFPAEVAQRYGAEPTTDIPLPTSSSERS